MEETEADKREHGEDQQTEGRKATIHKSSPANPVHHTGHYQYGGQQNEGENENHRHHLVDGLRGGFERVHAKVETRVRDSEA